MIYTSARYANAEKTMVIGTDADGNAETVPHDHKLFRQPLDGPLGFIANGGVIGPYVPPPVPPKTKLYKSTLIRRLSEDEATALSTLLKGAPDRSRMLFDAVEWLGSDDPLFTELKSAISAALGQDRANEILAEE